ncbi:hypothetical protein CAPTEDRAFT_224136 [Capitella teleta]|uniref:Aminopeptidase n=1 Tax=Capitella teleta TaxID=283909 RepID=R7TCZ0_CAPTE|nr:hypothetical protein CAPTEDRAFT_224136 [Capitella teleta]|eukprot:ELT91342.1 hypothetical protein CAPTEDRAFT_224136 [Capitella teleta]
MQSIIRMSLTSYIVSGLPGTPPCDGEVTGSSTPLPTAQPDRPEDYLLPDDLVPVHYDIELRPDIYGSDADDFAFTGYSVMHFWCRTATDTVVMHINYLSIDNSSIVVRSSSGSIIPVTQTRHRPEFYFYDIVLGESLIVGENYTISTNFSGPLSQNMAGMYWSSYPEEGQTKYMIATQFEAPDARRAFPCMDEPALKATFNVTLHHQSHMTALTNMPEHEQIPGENNWVATVFEKTSVVMPTYLLAFAVADYSFVNSTSTGGLTEKFSRYWARHEYIDEGYADYVSQGYSDNVFDYFETYFNHSYLLPKQDQIAIPDFAAGAMENWGLITYREERLLWNPQMSTLYEKQRMAGTVAHELLHQWLGNVVTCAWWSDIWLQEGMARVHQHLALAEAEPTWISDELFQAQVLYRALSYDQMGSAHPIHNPTIHTYRDPDSVFTVISYDKAGSFIRMIAETVLGLDSYERSMQVYVDRMQYGSAVYGDLFKAWDDQALADGITLNKNLSQACLTWIMQSGYPVLNFARTSASQFLITQELFLIEPERDLVEWYDTPYDYTWDIPIKYKSSVETEVKTEWFYRENNDKTINLDQDLGDGDWLLANVGHSGLFRVNYDLENWNALIGQLKTDHLVNIITIIMSISTYLLYWRLSIEIPLGIAEYLRDEREFLPWYALLQGWPHINRLFDSHSNYAALRSFIRNITSDAYAELGWDEDVADELPTIYLRTLILNTACENGHSDCQAMAQTLFRDWRADPSALHSIIRPDVRESVYCSAIEAGSAEDWEFLFEQYQESFSYFGAEPQRRADGLICTTQAWLINRMLGLAANGDESIRSSDRTRFLTGISLSSYGHSLAWHYLNEHHTTMAASHVRSMTEALVEKFSTTYDLEKLDSFLESFDEAAEDWKDSLRTTVNANIVWRMGNEEPLFNYLDVY